MIVEKKAMLNVINCKWSDELRFAFLWQKSPQGVNFWISQCKNGLNLEGAKALLEIVETAKRDGGLV